MLKELNSLNQVMMTDMALKSGKKDMPSYRKIFEN